MNEIIDFLQKENNKNDSLIEKIIGKKKQLPIQKNIEKKIKLAIENENKKQKNTENSIVKKIKPLKEIKKKDVVWL